MQVRVVDLEDGARRTHGTESSWKLSLRLIHEFYSAQKLIDGNLTALLTDGKAIIKLKFLMTTQSLRIRMTVINTETGETERNIMPWTSGSISVKERVMVLKPSSKSLPHNPRENDTLSPAAGVIIYDEITGRPADKNYLARHTWEARISLLYDDVYPGNLSGTTVLMAKSNHVIFSDVTITGWGYSYTLRVSVRALGTTHLDLHCLIGPFDVAMSSNSDLPDIDSLEFRTVSIAFDGNFAEVQKDPQKFNVFFLNKYGLRYPHVKWRNVTTSEGSVIVSAVIMGLTEDLEDTSKTLASDIIDGEADINYVGGKKWKASSVSVPTRKLLQDGGSTQNQNKEEKEGLPIAWIAAIVINAVLVVLFIFAVIFCYCRNRRKRQDSMEGKIDRNFRGDPEMLFVNKAANNGTEKTALIRSEQPSVFTVEEERRKLAEDEDEVDQFSHAESRARCTCSSPECYCSVGDYHKGEELKSLERKDNQMEEQISRRSYRSLTPEPEPVEEHIPTPEPEPEEEEEEYWRPDSTEYRINEAYNNMRNTVSASRDDYQEEPQQEEYDEYEETNLPGTIEEEPEPVQEKRYLVYRVMDDDGSREFIGHVTIPGDGTSLTLSDLRNYLQEGELSSTIRNRPFRLVNENLKDIPPEQMSYSVESIYPSEAINIKFGKRFKPPVLQKPKPPVYLGPLGICSAPDCFLPSRLKCLDCGNAAYCGTRCLKKDLQAHKKVCFKPAWRI